MPFNQQEPPNGDRLDRIERGLEHLLQTQASHEAAADARFERLETNLGRLVGVVEHLAEAQRAFGEETDRRFRQVEERFRETDERLSTLIRIVDEIVRRRPPGPAD